MTVIDLKCKCGQFRAQLVGYDPAKGGRAICYCDDCQAYAHALGKAKELMNANGGTDITPVMPSQFKIIQGIEQLRLLHLTEKGLNRFFVECCHTPVANSPGPQVPYLGMMTALAPENELGRVHFGLQARYAIGTPPRPYSQKIAPAAMWWMMKFMARAFVRGGGKPNVFFKENGQPVTKAQTLSPQERDHLRPYCGPHPTA